MVSGITPWGRDGNSILQFDTATPCLTLTPLPSFFWNLTVLFDSPGPNRKVTALQCPLTKEFSQTRHFDGDIIISTTHGKSILCVHVSMCVWGRGGKESYLSTNCLAVGWTKEGMLCIVFGLCRIFTKAMQGTFALLSSQV